MATNLDSVKMKELSDLLGIKLSNMEQLWHYGYTRPEKFAGVDILDLIEVIGFKEARLALPKIEKAFDDGLIDQAVQSRIDENTKWKAPGLGGLFAKTKKLHLRKEKKEGEPDAKDAEAEEPLQEEPQTEITQKSGLGLNKLKGGFPIHRKKEESNGDAEVKRKPGIGLARFKDKMKRKKERDDAAEDEEKADEPQPDDAPAPEDKKNEPAAEEEPDEKPAEEEESSGAEDEEAGNDVPKKSAKSTE